MGGGWPCDLALLAAAGGDDGLAAVEGGGIGLGEVVWR